jgi:hypothetical protein
MLWEEAMNFRMIGMSLVLLILASLVSGCGEAPMTEEEQDAIDEIEELVKDGIWQIHEALWTYKAEHGQYPEMIYGGDKEGWEFYNAYLPEGAEPMTDPLIEGEYLKDYPYNPFIRVDPKYEKAGLSHFRKGIVEFQHGIGSGDFDPRFGVDGDRMGNALLEPYVFVGPGNPEDISHLRMCPGQFFYRVYGGYMMPDELPVELKGSPLRKTGKILAYFMGAFGALDTEGGDIIRYTDMNGYVPPKFPYTYEDEFYIPHVDYDPNIQIPLTVPEVFGGGRKSVLPTYPPWGEEYRIICGAGDGYRDGVFYVVDYTGKVVEDKKEGEKADLTIEPVWSRSGFIKEGEEEEGKEEGEEGETPEPKPGG